MVLFYVNGKDYNTGIGLRLGYGNGITIKHFIKSNKALDGILSNRFSGIGITGLYEVHNSLFNANGLAWFYGAGAHIGFWSGSNVSWFDDNNDYVVIGIDGILGIEYSFKGAPVNLGLDWKPAFNLIGHSGFWGEEGAFSVRYIF